MHKALDPQRKESNRSLLRCLLRCLLRYGSQRTQLSLRCCRLLKNHALLIQPWQLLFTTERKRTSSTSVSLRWLGQSSPAMPPSLYTEAFPILRARSFTATAVSRSTPRPTTKAVGLVEDRCKAVVLRVVWKGGNSGTFRGQDQLHAASYRSASIPQRAREFYGYSS